MGEEVPFPSPSHGQGGAQPCFSGPGSDGSCAGKECAGHQAARSWPLVLCGPVASHQATKRPPGDSGAGGGKR